MTQRIDVRVVESLDSSKPVRLTPAQAGGPIHTRRFTGFYRNLRLLGAGFLFVLFFGTAWLNYGDRQAVLWDLGERKFHIFAATFWPQDFVLLSAILIIAAFGLFFITVLAGRVWCGYACPQSVWTWIFMRIENLTEGDRGRRIKLDAAPWSINKVLRRASKHSLWLLVSLITAMAFIGYFTPIRQLTLDLLSWNLSSTELTWLIIIGGATYFNAGWMREKICRDLCPYSRFQSVMFDRDTLMITYDSARGEGRGPRRKTDDYKAAGLGDCIDCTMCVQVCPTGIDIRDGVQLDCISCGACIDACDSVMDKMGYARGLVRYSSERALEGGKTRWLRPTLIGHGAMLVLMIGALIWALTARPLVSLDVTRDRSMFRENAAGQVENIYRLKLINKTQEPRSYQLGLGEAEHYQLNAPTLISLDAGEILDIPVSLARLAERGDSSSTVHFEVHDNADSSTHVSVPTTFLAPRR